MVRILHCRELMPGCDFVARAATVEALREIAERHFMQAHRVGLTPELKRRVEEAIRVEKLSSAL